MKMGELVLKDTRPLFFQALDLLEPEIVEKLKKEGEEMTLNFAKKFYNLAQVSNMRKATEDVASIINLALEKNAKDVNEATKVLKKHGLIHVFRQGWTLLKNLKELQEKALGLTESERDLFQSLRGKKVFCDVALYKEKYAEFESLARHRVYQRWLCQTYHWDEVVLDQGLGFLYLQLDRIETTIYLSILIREKPAGTIRKADGKKIVEIIFFQSPEEIVKRVMGRAGREIDPKYHRHLFSGGKELLMRDICRMKDRYKNLKKMTENMRDIINIPYYE